MITLPTYKPQFHSIPRDWEGQTCVVIGGGPSLIGFPFDKLRGRSKTIAVKAVGEYLPWCDVYFSLDIVEHKMKARLNALSGFQGELVMAGNETYESYCPEIQKCRFLKRASSNTKRGLSFDPTTIKGHNSGFGALNYAYLRGATKIILIGIDLTKGGYWYEPESRNWIDSRIVDKKIQTRDSYIRQTLDWFGSVDCQLCGVHPPTFIFTGTPGPLSHYFPLLQDKWWERCG